MIRYLLGAPRHIKRMISIGYDILAIPLSLYLALALRHGTFTPELQHGVITSIAITSVVSIIIFIRLGLYRAVVRFMAEKAFGSLLIGSILSALTLATASFLLQAQMPRSAVIIYLFCIL